MDGYLLLAKSSLTLHIVLGHELALDTAKGSGDRFGHTHELHRSLHGLRIDRIAERVLVRNLNSSHLLFDECLVLDR